MGSIIRITLRQGLLEGARELLAWLLALILLIPAALIRLIDAISSRIIARRGGLD